MASTRRSLGWALLALGLTAVLGLGVFPANAAYTTTQITNNSSNDWRPQINSSGQMVYENYAGGYYQIYSYNAGVFTAISATNTLTFNYIQINDLGQAAWEAWDGAHYQTYFYNGSTATQLGDAAYNNYAPSLNNLGQVVWTAEDGEDGEIYLYNGSTGVTTAITNNHVNDFQAQIDDSGQIVWSGYNPINYDYDIFLYSSGVINPITNNNYGDYLPKINGGHIVWYGHSGDDFQLYQYYLGTSFQIPNTNYVTYFESNNYQVNNRGQVVWGDLGGNGDLYFYDLASGATLQITDNGQYPQINDLGQVVYQSNTGGDQEIYLYSDFTNTQITNNSVDDWYPQINNTSRIVWGGDTVGYWDYEIFLATPSGDYTRYYFTYTYSDGSGDSYQGYVYAPASFKSFLPVGGSINNQPLPMGGAALNGAYSITGYLDDFDASFDKKSYITRYYDAGVGQNLGVSTTDTTTATYVYVADRSTAQESGYAIYNTQTSLFNTTTSASFTATAPAAPATQPLWVVYWGPYPDLTEDQR